MSRRWRYHSWIAAGSIALLIVAACGDSSGLEASNDESPAALALAPEAGEKSSADESTSGLRSEAVDQGDDFQTSLLADGALADELADDLPDDSPTSTANLVQPLFDPSDNDLAGLEADGNRYPFTGMTAPNAEAAARPVLMVKVDNHPRARPQTGLDQADMVFDLRAEGVTRFAAVFQSSVPDPVGPVRSSRTSDFDLLLGFDRPLYASSGGNANVAAGFRRLPIIEVTNLTRREYFRNGGRPPPHNLFVNASDLYALAPDDIASPEPWFQFDRLNRDLPDEAQSIAGPVTVNFRGSPVVTHTWDATVGGWQRTQDGNPHVTSDGDQLAPENVVIMVTDYSASSADPRSPEVRSTGSGDVAVLTAGHVIVGRWQRDKATEPLTLVDSSGDEILLTLGRTWILMPEQGQVGFSAGEKPPSWP